MRPDSAVTKVMAPKVSGAWNLHALTLGRSLDFFVLYSSAASLWGSPGQAKAMAQMYKQLAETGGVPYQTEMDIKMDGEGPMAGLMAKMGNITMTTNVSSVEAGPVSADLFTAPAGYKLKEQK